jgi:MFS family permease
MREGRQSFQLLLIFCSLSALHILSMFYRVSNAVIAPSLIQDLGLDAESLGILGGAFFYSFALLQFPLGPLLDRIGPRIIMPSSALIGAFGAVLFAFGKDLAAALVGRILIGVGMSSILMGSLKVFVLRFPPERFTTLMGVLLSVGTLGTLGAASPLAYLNATLGWRKTFVSAGAVTAILACLVFYCLGDRDRKKEGLSQSTSQTHEIGILQSMRIVFGSLAFWQIAAVSFFRYGTIVSLQGLWLGPYLMEIKAYAPVQAGNLLAMMAIGYILGSSAAGWYSDRTHRSKRDIALVGLSFYALGLFALTGIVQIQSPFGFGFLFFWISFFNAAGIVTYSHAKGLFPVTISATVISSANFFTMAGGAVFMGTLGRVIESFPRVGPGYPSQAYHLSFLICFLCMAASLIFYAFSKKERS